jgi:hypothetical protein
VSSSPPQPERLGVSDFLEVLGVELCREGNEKEFLSYGL